MSTLSLFGGRKTPPVRIQRGWASLTYREVHDAIPWSQYTISMYGQSMPRPRFECWFHDNAGRTYEFGGGEPITPVPLDGVVGALRERLHRETGRHYDSCFANRYDDGSHSIGWHADDDAWIGPVIASVSFGATRKFKMRPKAGCMGEPTDFVLGHGDLLIMEAGCQGEWMHSVPKTARPVGPRINLTYRTTREAGMKLGGGRQ